MKKAYLLVAALLVLGMSLSAQSFKYTAYDDKAQKGTSTIELKEAKENLDAKDKAKETVTYTATGKVTNAYAEGYAGIMIAPDAAMLKDLKAAKGVQFKVNGDGQKYRVIVETADIKDGNYYAFEFPTAKGKESAIKVDFKATKQLGAGAPAAFKADQITQLKIQTIAVPIPNFSVKIYDLELMK